MIRTLTIILLLLAVPVAAWAALENNKVEKAEFTSEGQETTVAITVAKPTEFKSFILENPTRLIVDIPNGEWKIPSAKDVIGANQLIKNIRTGTPAPQIFRIVFDLNDNAAIKSSETQKHEGENKGATLMVNLSTDRYFLAKDKGPVAITNGKKATEEQGPPAPVMDRFAKTGAANGSVPKPSARPGLPNRKPYKPTIVIDPGHGGMDPGAQGASGVYEKEVTLQYAKALQLVLQKHGYTVYLTRTRDSFVKLGDRVRFAKKYKPDIFISLHADSHDDPNIRGLSVYTLAHNRAERVAKVMKQKADKQEVIKGLDMRGKDDALQEMIIDMAQNQSANTALRFSKILVQEMGEEAKLLERPHRHGSFEILTGLEIPSVLIELGFLSNQHEEKMLRRPEYQRKLIKNIATAIDRYFENIQPE